MLNGAAVMDAAILLIASNEPCPQPQTSEHLAAVEIMHLNTILILQNKIDLVKESAARDQYDQVWRLYSFMNAFFETSDFSLQKLSNLSSAIIYLHVLSHSTCR